MYDPLWKKWVRPFEAKTEREVVLYPLLLELLRLELGDERAADAQYYTMVVSRMDPGGYEAKHVETWDIARAYLLEGGDYGGGQLEATLGLEPGEHLVRYDARAPYEVKPVTRGVRYSVSFHLCHRPGTTKPEPVGNEAASDVRERYECAGLDLESLFR